jgi:UDP-3-O-[3-hydroxymyristoyl] glucosamine N-acyltransferase
MPDSRFFTNAGGLSLGDIAKLTGAVVASGDTAKILLDVAPLDTATASHISFLDNVKYVDNFTASKAGACFVRAKFAERAPKSMALLVTEMPYLAFALTSQKFYPESAPTGISPHAHIAKSARVGKNVSIGPGTVIGEGVVIGDDCRIGALCTISHTLMGKRVILHRGIHIGQDGFGFAPGPKGIVKVPQLGRVVIEDDVEIGSGTCIDRGAGPDTIIGMGAKIDNLVQIGHNVQIGKFVVIAAQCGIAGSTKIGDGAMLGGQVGLSGHIAIGAGAKLAAQAGVMTDVPPGATYGGAPAVPIKDWHRQTATVAKLIKKKDSSNE